MVNELPVATAVPAEEAVYQSITSPPEPGVAFNTTVPVPQRAAPVTDGVTGIEFTVTITAVLVVEIQPVFVFLACA